MARPTRVLIVDDSSFMRGVIQRLLESEAAFEVAGQARDGEEAVRLAAELEPDLITMDFNMPGLNGAQATARILAARPVPILMLSAHTAEGAQATVQALSAGAVDFVQKPSGEVSASLQPVHEELLTKLRAAAGANLSAFASVDAPPPSARAPAGSSPRARKSGPRASRPMPAGQRLIVIASSTGGPAALMRVVPRLDLGNSALVIVQHMPLGFTAALAEQLNAEAPFPVAEARGGETLGAGRAFVARGGQHLSVSRQGTLRLDDSDPVHGVRPAADVTLKSAAATYGARTVGVVLTGMGRDGALGLAAVKAAGGRALAQDKSTSTVYGMPRAAMEMGVVDEVLPLPLVASAVGRLVS